MTSHRNEPVAIIGIGCLFPKADGPGAYWANICNKVDAITDIPPTHWRPEDYLDRDPKSPDRIYTARGAFLDPVPFPPLEFGITPNALEATDTTQLLGLMVARQALVDAGYAAREYDRNRVSVILGVTGALELVIPLGARLGHPIWRRALREAGVDDAVAEKVVQKIADSYVGWQEDSFPGLLGNVAAGRIANRLDLGGTNCVVDAACASSLGAIHLALLELEAGRSDLVVSGGLDTFNDIFMYTCFSKTPALSPTGSARPFDAGADGTILGEGLGVVVLKRHADAVRDGDRIYAVIRAVGSSSDGKGNAIYAPSPAGQMKALRRAYELAGVTPDTIELVEAHGTGTKAGDAAELSALAEVYRASGRPGSWCALGSVKSQIGHTKAAAGVAGLIKAALALHHKVLPPTIKVDRPSELAAPGKGPLYINVEKRPWVSVPGHPRRAAVSSFGFGGSNFHCVLEEAAPTRSEAGWDGNVQILAFSGGSREDVAKKLSAFSTSESWEAIRSAAARSREEFSPAHACRLVMVVDRERPIANALAAARAALEKNADRPSWSTPDRIYFATGTVPGKLALVFPGQGSQYVGMLRDLACAFPTMLSVLADADAVSRTAESRLSDRIYPQPAFDEAGRGRQEEALRTTDTAQPALGAVSLGAFQVLRSFGVWPELAAGHSYGELVALHAAGRIDAGELHRLSAVRGRLMADQASKGSGAMLAVRAALPQIEAVCKEAGLELTIANRNAPSQNVLSGPVDAIERAAAELNQRGIASRRLPVVAAFHSPLVADARGPFLDVLQSVNFSNGSIPVFANSTAQPYPADTAACRELLAGQLARPVAFVEAISNLYDAGARVFVEVGPGSVLTGLVGAILDDRQHVAVALDASSSKRSGMFDLAAVLAQLAALGYPIELKCWDAGSRPPIATGSRPTLTVPICGANLKARQATTPERPREAEKNGTSRASSSPVAPKAAASAAPKAQPPQPAVTLAPKSPVFEDKKPMAEETPRNLPRPTGHPDAVRISQENMLALQRLGEQTAQLHRQFLDGQDRLLSAFQGLLEQQQRLMHGSAALPAAPAPLLLPPAAVCVEPPVVRATPIEPPVRPAPQPVEPVKVVPVVSGEVIPAAPPPPLPAANNMAPAILLEVVSQKTGYPPEMLELDMELDSDLGIDSIKRVEIFSALQERMPEAPAVGPEHLGTLRTLRQVAEFLGAAPRNGSTKHMEPVPAARVETPTQSGAATAIQTTLLAVVSEKTGYPPEMLELDMELDSDLGIDSIKRVEIFSALQERMPEAPAVGPEHLGTLRTLRQVAEFLGAGERGCVSAPSAPVGTPAPLNEEPAAPVPSTAPLHRFVLRCEPLEGDERPALNLPAGGEVWISDDGFGLSASLVGRLEAIGIQARLVGLDREVFPAMPEQLGGLVIVAGPSEPEPDFIARAFALLQHTGPALRRAGAALLATVSRLDGAFGLEGAGAAAETGGLAGLAKTASFEWPEVTCRALDLSADISDPDEAALLLAEELLLEGPVEVGIHRQGRRVLRLEARPVPAATWKPVEAGQVVVISGGARGVTAEVAVALAQACRPTLVLLGRSTVPAAEPDWLAPLRDEADIKRALLGHASGATLAPRELNEEYERVQAAREVRRTLERITAAGGRALYRSVDIRNAEAVRAVLAEVRAAHGPIRGVIHGAGVLADRRIEDKTPAQFERVYATKVDGLRALLVGVGTDPLEFLVLFSSSTGRFGRMGQVDYAAANEALNKRAQAEAQKRPECRVLAVNWGPWDGGMVTPALKGIFANEGVGLIPLADGARYLVQELSQQTERAVEVVILGGEKAVFPEEKTSVRGAKVAPAATSFRGPAGTKLSVAFERELSVEQVPILRAHVLDGRAVLPLALMAEWLAHGAMHGNPGLAFRGFDDLRVLKGVRLEEDDTHRIRVLAGKVVKQDGVFRVGVEMRGGNGDAREIVHAQATIVLADRLEPAPTPAAPPGLHSLSAAIYETHLFHGPELQAIEAVDSCTDDAIVVRAHTAPPPAVWVQNPLRTGWLGDPLVLDAAFQALIVWCREQQGLPSLPCLVARYRQYRRSFPRGTVRVAARIIRTSGALVTSDIDLIDDAGTVIARLEGYECVTDAGLVQAFRRNRLTGAALVTEP